MLLAIFMVMPVFPQEPWQDLFNGKNLRGWVQLNGSARYKVEQGELVGTTVLKSPNSFLCTTGEYSDFILEYEVWVDSLLNSGVQIRSHSKKEYLDGRVYGYQIEIDPSGRAWSGGIYDEGRRAWLYPLDKNPEAGKAFKQHEWNHFRIEAIGNRIRTWINGVPAADLFDDLDASGFIALQVHGVGNDKSREGIQVKWRKIRIITLEPDQWILQESPDLMQISAIPNTLTPQEVQNGWKLLWDGKTTDGWRGADRTSFPEKGWTVGEGILTVNPGKGLESANGGDIVTRKLYGDFELVLDFMLTPGSNSGIKYYVTERVNRGVGSAIGLEYQLLDDEIHPDAKQGVGGNRTLASLYDLIPPLPEKRVNPPGAWNQARIVAFDNLVQHWLNGILVVEYERGTQLFNALVQKSKYSIYPGFGEAPTGHILLQDHGDKVSFKNIKIKEL